MAIAQRFLRRVSCGGKAKCSVSQFGRAELFCGGIDPRHDDDDVFFPHSAMPNLILKTEPKNDIIAYIMSLKK